MIEKKSESELKKLCGPKGKITKFQHSMTALLNEKNEIDLLLNLIILATKFQDKNQRSLTKIKEKLKKEESELFPKFGRFYATLKICGRDCYKITKHHSSISNTARVRKLKIGKTIHYTPTGNNVFLSSEFHRGALSLERIKEFKNKPVMGEFHELMMKDLAYEITSFISKNGKILTEPLC